MQNLSFDELTATYSESAFYELCERFYDKNKLQAVLIVDIDDMRFVNQILSREEGNRIISELALRIGKIAPVPFITGRVSGDTFAVFLQKPESRQVIEKFAERLVEEQHKFIEVGTNTIFLTLSVGVVICEPGEHPDKFSKMMLYSEIALSEAKENGKNQYNIFNGNTISEYERTINIRGQLQKIILDKDLRYQYQPLVEFKSGKTIGFEVLARLYNPIYGEVTPNEFLEIAKKNNLMLEFDRLTIEHGCKTLKEFEKLGLNKLYLSVNTSAEYFKDPVFKSEVLKFVSDNSVEHGKLAIEVTEETFVESDEKLQKMVMELKENGIKIYADDFGMGFSNMSKIEGIPFSALKIDKSLIDGVKLGSENIIVEKSIEIARSLDMTVVAEGVETEEQYNLLKQMGCDIGQGFWMGRPMDFKDAVIHMHKQEG